MSEELNAGQVPVGADQESGQTFDADYVAKLRAEAARYRNEAKTAKAQLGELQPLAEKARELEAANQSEAEKLAAKMAELQKQLEAAQAQAAVATKTQRLTALAAKAGVPAEVLPLLDVNKFDLEDEEATLTMLSKLKATAVPSGGSSSNPARAESNGQLSPAEWYAQRSGRTPTIFGG